MFYHLDVNGYDKSDELESFDHMAGISFSHTWHRTNTLWLETGGSKRFYNKIFDMYDRNSLFLSTGIMHDITEILQIRLSLDVSDFSYPEYIYQNEHERGHGREPLKEHPLDYTDWFYRAGANFTLAQKYAVDIDAGLQYRNYAQDGPTTNFFIIRTRISRPFILHTGLALFAQYHDQFDPGTDDIFTFYTRSVNVHEQLWDGVETGASLTRFIGQYKTKATFTYRNSDFIELPVELERRVGGTRSDNALVFNLNIRRLLPFKNYSSRVSLYADYTYERNVSTTDYFDYHRNECHIGISIDY